MYINCKTYFSFRYGTFSSKDLIESAVDIGAQTLALTNINNTCDMWDFVELCLQNNIQPVAGSDIRNDHEHLYILLAKNNIGLMEINKFLSFHLMNETLFPQRPDLSPDVFIIYPFEKYSIDILQDNEYLSIQSTEINKLFGKKIHDLKQNKYVIRQPVTFLNSEGYHIHKLLRAIDKNIVLDKLTKKDLAGTNEYFATPSELFMAFKEYPSLITNTMELLNKCSIQMDYGKDKTKNKYSSSSQDDKKLLEKLTLDGLSVRYGENKIAAARVKKELGIINDLGFNAYFLITYDIIRYAQSRRFFYVGRGSGANSIVAYCLNITDVDPIELDLYFERFLNPHRTVPPDFDLDFSWKDRDEIFDYIFKRYGQDHVCLLGTFVTFQEKAAIRELGKVFGLPKSEIDLLSTGVIKKDPIQEQIIKFGKLIKNFPNHLSIHAGGVLISDKPLYYYAATELPPKGFSTCQIDMFIAEKIGLYKLDILSQRGLGHIKETIELVKKNQGISIDIHDIEKFKKDPNLALQIKNAETIGCFYIESPGMRQLLKKLRCDDYITLVAASSIIRPGVAQSGMMKQYIHRFHHPEDFEYLHPKMEELLKETYGVMVYQEDVIKVAHHFAGLDLAEADVLRRAMSGKYRGREQFESIRRKFFYLCQEKGYHEDISKEVWRQIESFGGYSFSKAHSASFAVESYQSLYLKTYYPIEFMVAVINNFGGFYSRELYFHELKKTGARVEVPCINNSCHLTSIKEQHVFMGFIHIEGLEEKIIHQLIKERDKGKYINLNNFIERIHPGIEQLNILIRIGAFRSFGKNKKELLWEANFLQKRNTQDYNNALFKENIVSFTLPQLIQHPLDDAIDEIELLGFPLCNVFELIDTELNNYIPADEIQQYLGKTIKVIGYLITSKPVHTIKNETMYFHTFIDVSGDWLDTIFFPQTAHLYPVSGRGFYSMTGKVVEDFGVYAVEVQYSKKIGIKDRRQKANTILKRTNSPN